MAMKTIRSDKLNPGVLASPEIVDRANETSHHLKTVECYGYENDIPATIDYEDKNLKYHTSDETFSAVLCITRGLIYLNPRPAAFNFEKIYPTTYQAYDFSAKNFGLAYKVRSHFERPETFTPPFIPNNH